MKASEKKHSGDGDGGNAKWLADETRRGHLDAMRKLIEEAAQRAEFASKHDPEAFGYALALRGLLDPDKAPEIIRAARKRGKPGKLPDYWREQEGPFLDRVLASLEQTAEERHPDLLGVAAIRIRMAVAAFDLFSGRTDGTRSLAEQSDAVREALAPILPNDPDRLRLALKHKHPPRLHEQAAREALRALGADDELIKRLAD